VSYTHALFARKVQRKVRYAVAEFTAAESFLDQQKPRQFVPSQRYRGNDNRGREGPGPSCKLQRRSSNGNSLGWRVRGGPTESYQGISNTWLVYGFVSSSPLSPASQCGLSVGCVLTVRGELSCWTVQPVSPPSLSRAVRSAKRSGKSCQ